MDDTPGNGTTAHRGAQKPSSEAPSGRSRATAAPPTTAPRSKRTAPAPVKAARSAKAAGRASRAPRTARSGPIADAERTDGAEPGLNHDPDRGPWRAARNRALYNRRIQRSNEHWPLAARAVASLMHRPEVVLGLLGRPEPVERDGRILSRGSQALIELAKRFDAGAGDADGSLRPFDPPVMRRNFRRSARLAMPVRTDVHAWGRLAPGTGDAPPIPVRIYRQFGSGLGLGDAGQRVPAVVYFHGGGWVSGDLDTHDASCRMLAAVARCLVVAVHYRPAPEHPFPAAVDDALAAYSWVQRHADELGVDPLRVGVMGDSAGGNLAAVVALLARAGSPGAAVDVPPPVAQGLIYPVVDARLDTDSLRTLGEGFFLTTADMQRFRHFYLPDPSDWTDVRASPLLADNHRGVAPALVVTAGFDPLRDDGFNYAQVLRAAGVDVEYRCYDDQLHGFVGMGILSDSLAMATEVFEAMGRLIRRPAGAGLPT